MKKVLAALAIMLLVMGGVANATEVKLDDNKNSTYNIDFEGVSDDNTTWTFKVTQNRGRALSHWNLGFMYDGQFIDMTKYADSSSMEGPGQPSVGKDGSTNWDDVNILKWDTPNEFEEAEFSFKIDYEKFSQDYDVEKVEFQVMAKAGRKYSTGYVPEATFNTVSSTPPATNEPPVVPPLTEEETASLPPEYTTEEPAEETTPTDEDTTPTDEETTPAEDNTSADYVDDDFENIPPAEVADAVNEETPGTSGGTDTASSGTAATPEPATMFLLGLGLVGLAGLRKRFNKKN